MSEKKNLFGKIFGGKQKSGCCNIEIVEETENNDNCCVKNDKTQKSDD